MIRALDQVLKAPQNQKVLGRDDMVKNRAGGYVFEVDDWVRMDRFLMIGTEKGSYYASEKELTYEGAESVIRVIKSDGLRAVKRIVEISQDGRAPKNDYAIFALALAVTHGNYSIQKLALDSLPLVARTGTMLFQFVGFLKKLRGFGRRVKRGISSWYLDKDLDQLAYQLVKYRNRHGWTHRDVLRLVRPKVADTLPIHNILRWAVRGEFNEYCHQLILDFEKLQAAKSEEEVAELLRASTSLSHEMVPTEYKAAQMWRTLLDRKEGLMPMTALIRNLPTLTRLGILKPMSARTLLVADRLMDRPSLNRARVHPISMLLAAKTYEAGQSVRGSAEWEPVQEITDALGKGMEQAFRNLPHIPRRVYIAVDISGSMFWSNLMGVPGFTPALAACALSICLAKQCKASVILGFGVGMVRLGLSANSNISQAVKSIHGLNFQGTDCAQPMLNAMKERIEADAFIILTDSETWAGRVHPFEALKMYRRRMNIDAKLAVVGMTSDKFSIADPSDAGMMDFVGFDSFLPQILQNFLTS